MRAESYLFWDTNIRFFSRHERFWRWKSAERMIFRVKDHEVFIMYFAHKIHILFFLHTLL